MEYGFEILACLSLGNGIISIVLLSNGCTVFMFAKRRLMAGWWLGSFLWEFMVYRITIISEKIEGVMLL